MHHRRRWGYSPAIAFALAGIGLKILQWYHSRTMWLDEEMIFLNIRDRMWSELAGPLWLDQTAPVGWLALQRAILQLFGTGDRAVRALSVLFGVATLICAVWVGLRWLRPAGAALFILLCSFTQWMTFYALEAKPYAGDAFWALLLPASVVWATEGNGESSVSLRRSLVWWITATVGQWISYGAIFVAPGCAVLLCVIAWRRNGWRRALFVALQGIPWLVCFAAHYYLVMRHARASTFLTRYWSTAMPPNEATIVGRFLWLGQQAEPLASHPGGTSVWLIFWLAIGWGLAVSFRERPTLALSWLLVPLSACLLAIVGLVPLTDRLALWMVPALFAAIALAADDLIRRSREWLTRVRLSTLALVSLTAWMAWLLCADIAQRAQDNLFFRTVDNHGLNDRSALRLLMVQRQPGDVLIATHFGLPAVWWYGGISIADMNRGRRHEDGARIFVVTYAGPGSRTCRAIRGQTYLQRALSGAPRAAVHLGFDSRSPSGFQELILDEFSEFSRLVSFKLISSEGAVAIFDLASPPDPSMIPDTQTLWRRTDKVPRLAGCVAVRRAQRW